MDIFDAIKSRHSVRQYTAVPIEESKREMLDKAVKKINGETGLNIQIIYDEPSCFDSFMAHYGKFQGVKNYIALVGVKSTEAEQMLGYYGEKLVLEAQKLGLNTCWVALTHGKSKAAISKDEKLFSVISLGYGVTEGVPHLSKALEEVCNYCDSMPSWFKEGVEAALMAPTAMNQQKFYFEYLPDGRVKAYCKRGFYSRLDLGIAICHFEAITGQRVIF